MVGSVASSRSDNGPSRSDGPSQLNGSSRPDSHGGASRRGEAALSQAGRREGTGQIDTALRREAGRTALTERLAASGVLRELSMQVDGPGTQSVAHPAELGQQAWGGPERLVLADAGALPAPGLPSAALPGLPEAGAALRAVRALTPAGAAVVAAVGLERLNDAAAQAHIQSAANRLGLDLGTAEGVLAAQAFAATREAVVAQPFGPAPWLDVSAVPKDPQAAVVAGEAAALVELAHPGTFLDAARGEAGAEERLEGALGTAMAAMDAGRLRPAEGPGWSEGWVETFPAINPAGSDLLDLPGFTAEGLARFGGTAAPHDPVEMRSLDDTRDLPPGVPDVAPDGRPVRAAPEGKGLPPEGPPDSWVVGPRGDRLYGPDGRPARDVDWAHDHGRGRPHVHEWTPQGRGEVSRPPEPDEVFSGPGRHPDGQIKPGDWQ